MTDVRFPILDGDYRPEVEVIDGVPTLFARRDVIEELTLLEPSDVRTDSSVTIPVRSVWNPACGPAVEVGPFTLDDCEVVKLYNALGRHINSFPHNYRLTGGTA